MKDLKMKVIDFDELELPNVVYKYRDWNNKFHKSIINNLEVYMSAPLDFEDPLDCKNLIRYDLLTDEEIYSKYYSMSLEENVSFTEDEHKKFSEEWSKKSPIRDKDFINEQQEKDFLAFNERTGVLSLTSNQTRTEMWIKYSANHTGFCVGFNPKAMFKYLGGGQKVEYCDNLPIIKPTPWDNHMVQMIKQIYHKMRNWEFEEEYRTQTFSPTPLTTEKRIVKLPIEAYREIIFGANISKHDKDEITLVSKKLIPHIKFYQAKIDNNNITIHEIL